MSAFEHWVKTSFGFLESDAGFTRMPFREKLVGESVEYVKWPLLIFIGWYKGEIDVNFHIDIGYTENHPVFRPNLPRTFPLHQVVLRQDKDAYASWPGKGGALTSVHEVQTVLRESARIMQEYCAHLLQGDLGLLEQLVGDRTKRSRQYAL